MGRGRASRTILLEEQCADILEEIQPATVRAVGYRAFVLKLIPDMSRNSMQRIGRVLIQARESGVIPWSWIVDETRDLERVSTWADPDAYRHTVSTSYRKDFWRQQPNEIEVWSEKGTMRGTLKPVLDRYGVGFRVMHGYGSATVIMDIARRTRDLDRPLEVLYLGDWDPSGMHMSAKDLPDRLANYGARVHLTRLANYGARVHLTRLANYGARVHLTRLALTPDDLMLPDVRITSFPATDKQADARYPWFVKTYGHACWELDALSPVLVRDRVEDAIGSLIDWDAWDHDARLEEVQLDSLNAVMTTWANLASAS